ncbi:hypothetical protein K32_04280 [Kaistia sp. 32K]|uniref:MbcA/ParS/Xre antitoxin family protein n=1 Tax=Kaistia sp. 32K TaxID=2795690 RepID=UPI001916AAC8|nr:MbcA/ParS/Xre antitoxin family protein [Kaistia sp. 32K]BCP51811.1 hypothetical protein K32_04280 [Kaistia sp. 32K]
MPRLARTAELATVAPDRFAAPARRRLGGPGLRTFSAIADRWGLGEADRMRILGQPGRSTYFGWLAKARSGAELMLPVDTLIRISALLGIYQALKIVFPSDAEANRWLTTGNTGPLFGGQPPMALITAGTQDGMMLLRRHLDAWRGGLFSAPLPGFDDEIAPIETSDIVWA